MIFVTLSQYSRINDIIKYPNLPWNRKYLSHNKGLTINIIETLELPNAVNNWNWNFISIHVNIKDVYKHPNKSWNKERLVRNKSLTLEDAFTFGLLDKPKPNPFIMSKFGTDIVIVY